VSNINCDVISDLLPLYTENMVSGETRIIIEEHLAECESCRAKLGQMTAAVPAPVKENMEQAKPLKKFRFHMLLNILGFPIWLPLLATAFSLVLTTYICIWVVVICVWCVPLSFGAASLSCVISAAVAFTQGLAGSGLLYVGCIIAFAGLAALSVWPSIKLTGIVLRFTVYLFEKFKKLIGIKKKEEVKNV
jgi:predicted anti-sigma-YlaC factor YlaD